MRTPVSVPRQGCFWWLVVGLNPMANPRSVHPYDHIQRVPIEFMKKILSIAAASMMALSFGVVSVDAAAADHHKASHHSAKKSKKAAEPEAKIDQASPEQMQAAEMIKYGESACEFNQKLDVGMSSKYPGYVDLSFKGKSYLMKPILSSTGALRLEDVKGVTLLIQIAKKSMLMNTKTGERLVDECVFPKKDNASANASAESKS